LDAPEKELVVVEPLGGYHSDDYGDGDFVWRLNQKLYGLRTAPSSWQEHLAELLLGLGFTRGVFEPTLFHHVERTVFLDTHIDDIRAASTAADLTWVIHEFAKSLLIKVEPIHDIGSSFKFLRATRTRTSCAMFILPATRYIDVTAAALGLEKATSAA
jgi:hypothetical protein